MNETGHTVDELCWSEPLQWGLRGDPHAWAAMCENVSGVTLPPDDRETRRLLAAAFEFETGLDLTDPGVSGAQQIDEVQSDPSSTP